jgi:hypothetical protein
VSGDGFASLCRYVVEGAPVTVNETGREAWWFCKADYLEHFFAELAPDEPFVLLSHNSDRAVDGLFRREFRRRTLVVWFAQNLEFAHRKVRSLPIGLANAHWPHGDQTELERVRAAAPPKRDLFDVSFAIDTNPVERRYCLDQTGLAPVPRRDYRTYLEGLAAAYFCISPRGNGLDVHRSWEALTVGTVPVVTRSLLTDQHPDVPFLVLDDWSDFHAIDFSPELYREVWGSFDVETLRLASYAARLDAAVAARSRRRLF